jgi:hypothetical protein
MCSDATKTAKAITPHRTTCNHSDWYMVMTIVFRMGSWLMSFGYCTADAAYRIPAPYF